MAATHLQVKEDATIINRATVLWPSSKNEQKGIIKHLFEQNNWTVSFIENQNGSFWKLVCNCLEQELKINLYISSIRDEARAIDEFKMQLGSTYPEKEEAGWITLVLGIYTIPRRDSSYEFILSGYDIKRYDFSTNPSIRGTRTAGLQMAKIYGFHKTDKSFLFRPDFLYYYISNIECLSEVKISTPVPVVKTSDDGLYDKYLTAIRTKPFILLAGISGTGKSRIVREFAFKSCPKYLQDKNGTTPGNYCMIEVKPNWHDSTELLGYYSNLSGSYQFKKFVKFLVKAMMFPDVPFFVCLDEMNLAPVEQYFAEILSIIETRKHPKGSDGEIDMSTIKTDAIIEGKFFKEFTWKDHEGAIHTKVDMTDKNWYEEFFNVDSMTEGEKEQVNKYQYSKTLQEDGLTLPDNLIIIGTVNMDDTTHQFSRKVIDRAMTIEMNGGKLEDLFGGSKDLEYIEDEEEQKKWQNSFSQRYVTADEVLEAHPEHENAIKKELPERLDAINMALKGTPFEVSYRVLNELTIMVGVMLDDKKSQVGTIDDAILEDIINQAVNNILLMKILPRIEGDAEMFALSKEYKNEHRLDYDDRLKWLKDLAPEITQVKETQTQSLPEQDRDAGAEEGAELETKPQVNQDHQQTAKEKIKEMIDRLNNQDFTRFWP